MEYSPTKFKEKMDKYGFNLKKMFGQNFIIDENVINNIIIISFFLLIMRLFQYIYIHMHNLMQFCQKYL